VDVAVEGRTVYLRGSVDDPAAVDAAAERIHAVDGVVAVVNLTTGRPTTGESATGGGSTRAKKS
jgi:osmotically-inducible protein OsmY